MISFTQCQEQNLPNPSILVLPRLPLRSRMLRPGSLLIPPCRTLSMGFKRKRFPFPCHPSYMALASTMTGLPPVRMRYPSLGTLECCGLTPVLFSRMYNRCKDHLGNRPSRPDTFALPCMKYSVANKTSKKAQTLDNASNYIIAWEKKWYQRDSSYE